MEAHPGMQWLRRLSGDTDDVNAPRPPRLCVVVAHPDDEVIGAGSRLPLMHEATFIHVTDGSPLNEADALHASCTTREGYADLRRRELQAVFALAGFTAPRLHTLGFVDQQASAWMHHVALALAAAFNELRPEVVLTHPYEGGHPDHDATAFAVHAAAAMAPHTPVILEMTSYHAASPTGGASGPAMVTSQFLPPHDPRNPPDPREVIIQLTPPERGFKQDLFNCFASQQRVLQQFPIGVERFRPAPRYDFTRPPHEGTLYYEQHDWGMTGERWRALAAEAIASLAAHTVHTPRSPHAPLEVHQHV